MNNKVIAFFMVVLIALAMARTLVESEVMALFIVGVLAYSLIFIFSIRTALLIFCVAPIIFANVGHVRISSSLTASGILAFAFTLCSISYFFFRKSPLGFWRRLKAVPGLKYLFLLVIPAAGGILIHLDKIELIGNLIQYITFPLFYLMMVETFSTKKDTSTLYKVLLTTLIITLLSWFYFYFVNEQYVHYIHRGGFTFKRAGRAIFLSANDSAIFLSVFLPLLYFKAVSAMRTSAKLFYIALFCLAIFSMLTCFTRSAIIGTFAGFMVLALLTGKRKVLLGLTLTMFLLFFTNNPIKALFSDIDLISLFTGTESMRYENTLLDRIHYVWLPTLKHVGKKDLLIGGGIGRYDLTSASYFGVYRSPHNYWLRMLVEVGIAGPILILLFFYDIYKKSVRWIFKNKSNLNVLIIGSTVASLTTWFIGIMSANSISGLHRNQIVLLLTISFWAMNRHIYAADSRGQGVRAT